MEMRNNSYKFFVEYGNNSKYKQVSINVRKKVSVFLTCVSMILFLVPPIKLHAAATVLTKGGLTVSTTDGEIKYNESTHDFYFLKDGDYKISGTTETERIYVTENINANITLTDVCYIHSKTTDTIHGYYPALICTDEWNNLTIIIDGELEYITSSHELGTLMSFGEGLNYKKPENGRNLKITSKNNGRIMIDTHQINYVIRAIDITQMDIENVEIDATIHSNIVYSDTPPYAHNVLYVRECKELNINNSKINVYNDTGTAGVIGTHKSNVNINNCKINTCDAQLRRQLERLNNTAYDKYKMKITNSDVTLRNPGWLWTKQDPIGQDDNYEVEIINSNIKTDESFTKKPKLSGYEFGPCIGYGDNLDNLKYTHEPPDNILTKAGALHIKPHTGVWKQKDKKHTFNCENCDKYLNKSHTAWLWSGYDCTEDEHSRKCKWYSCSIVDKQNHDWIDQKITKQPTTSSEGEKTQKCSVCKKTHDVIIPKLVQQSLTTTANVDNLTLSCIARNIDTLFPENATLSVTKMIATDQTFIDQDGKKIENAAYLDIKILDSNGNPIARPGTVEILIELPENWDEQDMKALLIKYTQDENLEVSSEIIDGKKYIKFKTNHFSPYMIYDELTQQDINSNNSGEKILSSSQPTGQNSNSLYIAIAFSLVSLLAVLFVIINYRHKNNSTA